jgi:hypothetical protein
MKNIHLLPTDKPSRLRYNLSNVLVFTKELYRDYGKEANQNIYITNSEEIKKGDWYCSPNGIISKHNGSEKLPDNWRKIILTTDQDLIKDGVQAIDDEFLGWFVKNPTCEEVDVIYDKDTFPYGVETAKGYGWYKIIIPREEPKQETLEEAIDRIAKEDGYDIDGDKVSDFVDGMVKGAKWQAERMYSEEEVLKLLRKCHFVEQNIEK